MVWFPLSRGKGVRVERGLGGEGPGEAVSSLNRTVLKLSQPETVHPTLPPQRLQGLLPPLPAPPLELPQGGEAQRPLGFEGAERGTGEEILVLVVGGRGG